MSIIEQIGMAIALAMDAFAVAVCKGLCMRKINYRQTAAIGVSFGFFQGFMPFLGWLLGKTFKDYITAYDHWIAFILLAFLGGKMIFSAIKGVDEEENLCRSLRLGELLLLSLATSIDALAIGITFAVIEPFGGILFSVLSIAVITCVISIAGVFIGNRFGSKYKEKAEVFGGVILILIGFKILLSHLGVIDL